MLPLWLWCFVLSCETPHVQFVCRRNASKFPSCKCCGSAEQRVWSESSLESCKEIGGCLMSLSFGFLFFFFFLNCVWTLFPLYMAQDLLLTWCAKLVWDEHWHRVNPFCMFVREIGEVCRKSPRVYLAGPMHHPALAHKHPKQPHVVPLSLHHPASVSSVLFMCTSSTSCGGMPLVTPFSTTNSHVFLVSQTSQSGFGLLRPNLSYLMSEMPRGSRS